MKPEEFANLAEIVLRLLAAILTLVKALKPQTKPVTSKNKNPYFCFTIGSGFE